MGRQCGEHLDRFFALHPNTALAGRTRKALRIILSDPRPLSGKPEGWAAGIVYAIANRGRQACGVPGLLNHVLEEFFCVSMSTIRGRAARVEEALAV
jgi:hypothetical protein